jgi:hypothetical protein
MRRASVLAMAALTFVVTSGAGGAPPSFQLVFDGKHNDALLHEGTFTTSSAWCSSGSAADVEVDDLTLTATRKFTCAEGGTFTAKVGSLRAEHGGSGRWRIVAGTGPLANLRGSGTFTSVLLTGSTDNPATITFRSTWQGVADFDAVPPTVGLASSSVTKLKRPPGTYSVRLMLSLADTGGGPVSYSLQVIEPKTRRMLAFRSGMAATGTAALSLRVRVAKSVRLVQISVNAADAVGNESTFTKKLRLR